MSSTPRHILRITAGTARIRLLTPNVMRTLPLKRGRRTAVTPFRLALESLESPVGSK